MSALKARPKWRMHIKPQTIRLTRALSFTQSHLQPPSLDEESAQFEAKCLDMASFFSLPRFFSLKRPYTPADVVTKQGSFPILPLPSTLLANKLYTLLDSAAKEHRPVHTIGVVDPVQMTQLAPYSEVVYISGWVCSSTLTTGFNDVGPDVGYGS